MENLSWNLPKIEVNKNNINAVPGEPGIYIFWNKDLKPHYVGKSVSLKNRLQSYVSSGVTGKTKEMISESPYFSFIRVNSELESLLLEAKLIKILLPKYNIELKDDKHPLYIIITKDKYPQVLTARKKDLYKRLIFYGPFPSSYVVKSFLKKIRRVIPYADHPPRKRPCLYNQIGLCAPCPSAIELLSDEAEKKILTRIYMRNIKILKKILDGDISRVYSYFRKRMDTYSARSDYEKAILMREQIKNLEYVSQSVNSPKDFLQNPNLLSDIRKNEKNYLNELLKPFYGERDYARIECYDITHLSGTKPVASMVTFVNGEADKNLYRRFAINPKKGGDDYSSLREVAVRRLKHRGDWGFPDLMIIDGGKGQVSEFIKVYKKQDIPIVGLAKKFETIVIPTPDREEKYLEVRIRGPILNLFQRIRNEAHRFARKYHHLLIEKQFVLN